MPARRERLVQPEVRHHRDRDRVVAQRAPLVQVERGDHHDLVAVDEHAALVDREHAIGVAVERETGVGARGHDAAPGDRRGASNRTAR